MLIAIIAILFAVVIACSLTVFIKLDALNDKALQENKDSENTDSDTH